MRQRGAALTEFIVMFFLGLTMVFGTIQFALIYNAHSMLKLAAFNAARAAIVARGNGLTDPVTLDQMKDKAKLAAYLTILPVIPAIQGRVPTDLMDAPGALLGLVGGGGGGGPDLGGVLGGLGGGWNLLEAMFEYTQLEVKFVDPEEPNPIEADEENIDSPIEFDDRSETNVKKNRIKVLVTWNYRLVIPFVDRIIYAAARPDQYRLSLIQKYPSAAFSDTDFRKQIPAWAVGTTFYDTWGEWRLVGFRIPLRASYVMRMQWDRRPG